MLFRSMQCRCCCFAHDVVVSPTMLCDVADSIGLFSLPKVVCPATLRSCQVTFTENTYPFSVRVRGLRTTSAITIILSEDWVNTRKRASQVDGVLVLTHSVILGHIALPRCRVEPNSAGARPQTIALISCVQPWHHREGKEVSALILVNVPRS